MGLQTSLHTPLNILARNSPGAVPQGFDQVTWRGGRSDWHHCNDYFTADLTYLDSRRHVGYGPNLCHGIAPHNRSKSANAQNRCAIARCAGSPTASAVTGGEIVDSGRGVLS